MRVLFPFSPPTLFFLKPSLPGTLTLLPGGTKPSGAGVRRGFSRASPHRERKKRNQESTMQSKRSSWSAAAIASVCCDNPHLQSPRPGTEVLTGQSLEVLWEVLPGVLWKIGAGKAPSGALPGFPEHPREHPQEHPNFPEHPQEHFPETFQGLPR